MTVLGVKVLDDPLPARFCSKRQSTPRHLRLQRRRPGLLR